MNSGGPKRRLARPLPRPRALLCVLAGILLAPGAAAAATLTLDDAVRLALDRARILHSERLAIAASRAAEEAAGSAFQPRFALEPFAEQQRAPGLGASRAAGLRARMTLGLPTGGTLGLAARVSEADPASAGAGAVILSLEQPLLRGAGRDAAEYELRASRRAARIAQLRLIESAGTLVTAVGRAYRAWAGALRRVGLAEDALARSRARLAINDTLIAAGRMAREDRVETEAEVARREVTLSEVQGRADAARRSFADLLDLEEGVGERRPEPLAVPRPAPPADFSDPVATALRQRPDVAIARLALAQAQESLALARDGLRPAATLRLEAAQDRERETLAGSLAGFSDGGWRVGVSVTMPIGPAAQAPERLAFARAWTGLRQARLAQAELRQRVRVEVEGAIAERDRSRERLELARTALMLARRKAEVEREKLALGVSSNFRVGAFESARASAEEAALAALAAHLDAEATLDLALGRTLARWRVAPESLAAPPGAAVPVIPYR